MADSRTPVVGAGATGGYFGGRLAQAGKDVTFLVRPGRAAALVERGLRIHAPDGGTEVITLRTVTAGALDGPYDVVVVGVTATAAGFPPRIEDRLRATVTGAGASTTSSMYPDLVQGLPVEADQIIGDLVSRAAGLGVPAPLPAFTNLRVDGQGRAG